MITLRSTSTHMIRAAWRVLFIGLLMAGCMSIGGFFYGDVMAAEKEGAAPTSQTTFLQDVAAELQARMEPTPRTRLLLEDVNYPYTGNSASKRYEDYTAITMRSSLNYQLLHGDDVIIADNGLILVEDCYAVAMGQQFGRVGDRFLVTFQNEDGTEHQVKIIMCDTKGNGGTQGGAGWFGGDGHIIEVIVDQSRLSSAVRSSGNVNDEEVFHGEVIQIQRILGEETYYVDFQGNEVPAP